MKVCNPTSSVPPTLPLLLGPTVHSTVASERSSIEFIPGLSDIGFVSQEVKVAIPILNADSCVRSAEFNSEVFLLPFLVPLKRKGD